MLGNKNFMLNQLLAKFFKICIFFLFIWKPIFFSFFSCNFTFSLMNAQVYVKGIQIRKWKMDFSMKTLIIGCRNTSWSQWLSPRKINKPIKSKFNESIVIRIRNMILMCCLNHSDVHRPLGLWFINVIVNRVCYV